MVRAVVAALRRYQGLGAVHRAARAAIVMPGMFAIGDKVIGDPTVATFAAFGSFAMILLVNFGGSLRERLEAQVALSATAAAMVCLGTLVSRTTWLAVVTMAAVAFGVLFAGVVSSVFASATTALLLAFILPVSLAAAPSAIPARLEGWGLACGAALLAMVLLWPARAPDPGRWVDPSSWIAHRHTASNGGQTRRRVCSCACNQRRDPKGPFVVLWVRRMRRGPKT